MTFEQGHEYIANAKEELSISEQKELKQLKKHLQGNKDAKILEDLKTTNENFLDKLDIIDVTNKIGNMINIFGEGELDIGTMITDFEVNPHFNFNNNNKESLRGVIDKLRIKFESNDIIKTGISDKAILKKWIQDNYPILPFFNSLNIVETTERVDGKNMNIGEATVDNNAINSITEKVILGGKLTLIPRSTNDNANLKKETNGYKNLFEALKNKEKIKPAILKTQTQLDNNLDNNKNIDKANLYLRARRALKYIEALGNEQKITQEMINAIQIDLVYGENANKPGMDAKTSPKDKKKADIGVYSSGLEKRSTQQPPEGTIFSVKSGNNTYYATYNYEFKNGTRTPHIQFDYTSPTNIGELNTNKQAIYIGEFKDLNRINSILLTKKAFTTE